LEQESGAHEKALQSYGRALRTVQGTDDFRSRWISLDEFRERILRGWTQWLESAHFSEAIALAELMTPLFPRDQAYELSARAHQKWADQLEAELLRGTASELAEQREALRELWRDTGAAYDRLAQARRAAENYREAVWLSTEFYRRGQDFQTALASINRFLTESSVAMLPVALARRGQILLDLDRVAEAEADFRDVVRKYPTSAAAYTAQYLLGVCRLERDDPHGAAEEWRSILASDRLTPAATEWRDALLSLARLTAEQAAWSRRKLEQPALTADEITRLWNAVLDKSTEAARLLDEYVARYPQSADLAEAQYHLGKSLQLLGDCRQRQWQRAETENSREQAQQELTTVLERALAQFRTLRDELTPASQADQLDPIRRQIWQNAWFEVPHTLFVLRRHEEAISAYAAAIHRFPHDVRVLTAYVQMAQAYTQLNRDIEARSMLEQAKVILDQNQIPVAAFSASTTNLTQQEWDQWLDRIRQVYR
jgi:TolA-binding protein